MNKGTAGPGAALVRLYFPEILSDHKQASVYLSKALLSGPDQKKGEGAARCVKEGKCLESLGLGFS